MSLRYVLEFRLGVYIARVSRGVFFGILYLYHSYTHINYVLNGRVRGSRLRDLLHVAWVFFPKPLKSRV